MGVSGNDWPHALKSCEGSTCSEVCWYYYEFSNVVRGWAPLSGSGVKTHVWKSETKDVTFEKYDSKDSLAFRANVAEVECLADLTPGFLPRCECWNSTSEGANKDPALFDWMCSYILEGLFSQCSNATACQIFQEMQCDSQKKAARSLVFLVQIYSPLFLNACEIPVYFNLSFKLFPELLHNYCAVTKKRTCRSLSFCTAHHFFSVYH